MERLRSEVNIVRALGKNLEDAAIPEEGEDVMMIRRKITRLIAWGCSICAHFLYSNRSTTK
jgi:hypothetical protein